MAIAVRFRADQSAVSHEQLNEFFDSRNYGGFGTFERASVTEKPHYHYALYGFADEKAVQACRVALKRKFPTLTKTVYSLTVADEPERHDRYIAKGTSPEEGPEVVWCHSLQYNMEKIKALHAAYWAENTATRKRKATGSMLDFVVEEAKSKAIRWSDARSLFTIYFKEMRDRGKGISMHAAKATINTAQLQLCQDDSAVNMLVDAAMGVHQ